MLHPDIILKSSHISGKGLFSKSKIPRGTIVFKRKNDVRIYTKEQYYKLSKKYRDRLGDFPYEDNNDSIIHHLDNTKYGNHSCEPTVTGIPYGDAEIEIAIKDIEPNQEITWDYGIIMPSWQKPFKCSCGSKNCRGIISRASSRYRLANKLQLLANKAERDFFEVKQPLLSKKEFSKLGKIIRARNDICSSK